jgi:hypothetical protein
MTFFGLHFPSPRGLRQTNSDFSPMIQRTSEGKLGFDGPLDLMQAEGKLTPGAGQAVIFGVDIPRGKWFWRAR